MSTERRLDLICLGRAAVDLYGEQLGAPLEEVQSFAKSVGGSAANIAVGAARQGLRVAMLTRVGDEAMGRFVRSALAAEGIDVSHVKTDPERLTALVLLAIRDRQSFPLIFYRERCADMALTAEDFGPEFIGSARALLVTGTHFSTPETDLASRAAMAHARAAGAEVILDIDYRPVLWRVTGHGQGEARYMASAAVSAHLASVLPSCTLVVGTEEEIRIAGGEDDTLAALRRIRERTAAPIVMKRGPAGCVVYEGPIPETLEGGFVAPGVPVELLNVLGAGDAFMAGLLRGWLGGEPWAASTRYANGAGALVVSRHGCAPAMPSRLELDTFLTGRPAGELAQLHRVTTRTTHWPQLAVFAFDHRRRLEELAAEAGADPSRLVTLKLRLAEAARQAAGDLPGAGVIIDGRQGAAALAEMTGRGWWVGRPIEAAGTEELTFEGEPSFELHLRTWPQSQVVKCLVRRHPALDPERRARQDARLMRLQTACLELDRELLLEIIPEPPEAPGTTDPEVLPGLLEELYAAGLSPDWWKLPPAPRSTWQAVAALVERRDPHCCGLLLLGFGVGEEALGRAMDETAGIEACKGFAVGRTIFEEAAARWLSGAIDDATLVDEVAARFSRVIARWRDRGKV